MSVAVYAVADEITFPPSTIAGLRTSEKSYRVIVPAGTQRFAWPSLILRAKQPREKISTLHLIAHGAAGKLFLSGVKYRDRVLDAAACSWFAALKSHFEQQFPRVIIHGCNVASDKGRDQSTGYGVYHGTQSGVGYTFLLAMAQATNAIAEGGIHMQGNDSQVQLEGARITVGPKGAAQGTEYQYAPYGEAL